MAHAMIQHLKGCCKNRDLGVARLQSTASALPCIALSWDKAASGALNPPISLGLGPHPDFYNSLLAQGERPPFCR